MIKVLHYVGKMNRGGMETFIMNLYRGINNDEYQFHFAVHEVETGDYDQEILNRGGKIFVFPHMRNNPLRYRMEWRKFWNMHRNEYQAFHFHTNSLANIIAFEESYRAGIQIRIIHAHSSFSNKGRLQFLNDFLHQKHQKKITKYATNLLACSPEAALWLYGQNVINKSLVQMMKNGVSISDYVYDIDARNTIRKEFGVEERTILIGHVAAFFEVKNHKYIIEIARYLKELGQNFLFVLVGEGRLKKDIINLVKEQHLDQYFVFTGVRSDVNRLLSAFDIVVLPSLYEGLPVSLIEAQINGVPVIVSDNVSRAVKLNDNLKFASTEESASTWAEMIIKTPIIHEANMEKIIDNGYSAKMVCKEYLKLINRGDGNE